jgi:YVTN family beta-propeller protein
MTWDQLRRHRPWIAAAAVVILVVSFGATLMLRGDDSEALDTPAPASSVLETTQPTPTHPAGKADVTFELTVTGVPPAGAAFAIETMTMAPELGEPSAGYLCGGPGGDGDEPCSDGGVYTRAMEFPIGSRIDYHFFREVNSGGEIESIDRSDLTIEASTGTVSTTYSFAAAPTPGPTPAATPEPLIGIRRVIVNDLRVRVAPGLGGESIGTLQEGEVVALVTGPQEADGLSWWQVEVGSLMGWAAEGTADGAFLAAIDSPESLAFNVWAATTADSPMPEAWRDIPTRVYVPNEASDSVSVIDAATYQVIDTLAVGDYPLHVTPAWDGSVLYADNMRSHSVQEIDPRTGLIGETIPIPGPYNLYFTPDGSRAVVMVEEQDHIDFYDPGTWEQLKRIDIPSEGVDHADFSAGGRYLLASTEFGGDVFKVDVVTMEIVDSLHVGGKPVDVKLAPDGLTFYVTNQERHGVSAVDPITMTELLFIPTGPGAHGLAISRDTRFLYVSNRLEGTISVIQFASRQVVATWEVGSTPDMLQVSADGRELWVSYRYDVFVGVIDTTTGEVLDRIRVGGAPHGLALFPQPGRYSLGHNGVFR